MSKPKRKKKKLPASEYSYIQLKPTIEQSRIHVVGLLTFLWQSEYECFGDKYRRS